MQLLKEKLEVLGPMLGAVASGLSEPVPQKVDLLQMFLNESQRSLEHSTGCCMAEPASQLIEPITHMVGQA